MRLLALLNNIGVATEILGMLVFAVILLIFANNQPPEVLFQTFGAEQAQNGDLLATFMLGFFMSVFIVYGFDTAGSFGEETVDASRQAPRGVLSSIWISGLVGTIFLLAVILSIQDIPGQMAAGLAGEFPDRQHHPGEPDRRAGLRHYRWVSSTWSSSWSRCSSARWPSRAPRRG